MRQLVFCDVQSCVGCNRCVRNCPVETANVTTMSDDGNIRVDIDKNSCIACGKCIEVCRHNARTFDDDTDKFLSDLENGKPMSVIIAPAIRANNDELSRFISWLKRQGARRVYDVSLGADICTWAHIRYIEKRPGARIITQPCPVVVNYILNYRQDLVRRLSPIHSPMACLASYMKNHEKLDMPIAAISPCIAKSHEFDRTGLIKYNVTFSKLFKYFEENRIVMPSENSGFDHHKCSLGSIFSMPGGLKKNIEFYMGDRLRIDRAEGIHSVYKALDIYGEDNDGVLPDVFDVLNCEQGCNVGSATASGKNLFEINHIMDTEHKQATGHRDNSYYETLLAEYDDILDIEDYLCRYEPLPVLLPTVSEDDIEKAFLSMDKKTDIQRKFDCSACGSNTCYSMARKIALHVNIPENCMLHNREVAEEERMILSELHTINTENAAKIEEEMDKIKDSVTKVYDSISTISNSMASFSVLEYTIDEIASDINIIALNASIAAAKLGDEGAKFDVIAGEIRELAKSSRNTIKNNRDVFSSAKGSVGAIESMMKQIVDIVTETYENVKEIKQANEKTAI